jgi:hypothetical protein
MTFFSKLWRFFLKLSVIGVPYCRRTNAPSLMNLDQYHFHNSLAASPIFFSCDQSYRISGTEMSHFVDKNSEAVIFLVIVDFSIKIDQLVKHIRVNSFYIQSLDRSTF